MQSAESPLIVVNKPMKARGSTITVSFVFEKGSACDGVAVSRCIRRSMKPFLQSHRAYLFGSCIPMPPAREDHAEKFKGFAKEKAVNETQYVEG